MQLGQVQQRYFNQRKYALCSASYITSEKPQLKKTTIVKTDYDSYFHFISNAQVSQIEGIFPQHLSKH